MRTLRMLLVAALCGWLAACAALEQRAAAGPEVLVTFPLQPFSDPAVGASKKAYHGGGAWQAPLHTRDLVRRFARDHDLTQTDAWAIEPLNMYCVAFTASRDISQADLLARLNRDGRVTLAQPNQVFEAMTIGARTYDDPLFELQYGTFRRAVERLHEVSLGQDVRIGVIDSSVDVHHPDLEGQIAEQRELLKIDSLEDIVHGTAVTGVIAAAAGNGEGLVGLAPEASIFVYGACKKHELKTLCTSFALAKALVYAMQEDIEVLNMSLAGPDDPLLAMLIRRAIAQGMIVIAADGAARTGNGFPADMPEVYSVGDDSPRWFAREEQLSTQAGGGYQIFFGASIATAGYTGMAALLRSANSPAATSGALAWLLGQNCRAEPQPHLAGFDPTWLCE